jgi:hypothetical protein
VARISYLYSLLPSKTDGHVAPIDGGHTMSLEQERMEVRSYSTLIRELPLR